MPEVKEAEREGNVESVELEDVDEIIGLAAKKASASPEQLSIEDLVAVGAEIGIPEAAIQRAVVELEARRRLEAEAQAAARVKRRRVGAIGAGVLVLLVILGLVGQSSLRSRLATVEQKRAQVKNVIDRQAHVEERLKNQGSAASPDQEAERAGAENRVAIERRRYDEAVAEYNGAAGSFPGSLWAPIFGLPSRAPLSNEVASW